MSAAVSGAAPPPSLRSGRRTRSGSESSAARDPSRTALTPRDAPFPCSRSASRKSSGPWLRTSPTNRESGPSTPGRDRIGANGPKVAASIRSRTLRRIIGRTASSMVRSGGSPACSLSHQAMRVNESTRTRRSPLKSAGSSSSRSAE